MSFEKVDYPTFDIVITPTVSFLCLIKFGNSKIYIKSFVEIKERNIIFTTDNNLLYQFSLAFSLSSWFYVTLLENRDIQESRIIYVGVS